jgi:3-methyladenine DNA glycosylase AlkD
MIRLMSQDATAAKVRATLARLERLGSRKNREGMARYGLVSKQAFGISVGTLRSMASELGADHRFALALWRTGWYEARMLAVFVDEPAKVTPAQMDRWCRDFDNWGICDTACFALFDQTPHAFRKIRQWAPRREEFVRRASFALLASVALHDKKSDDKQFIACVSLIKRAAEDDRNFVKKGVSWALRSVGSRNIALHRRAIALARKLATSKTTSARWIGNDALRDLERPLVARRLARKAKRPGV